MEPLAYQLKGTTLIPMAQDKSNHGWRGELFGAGPAGTLIK